VGDDCSARPGPTDGDGAPETVQLADDRMPIVREMKASDAAALTRFHRTLTPETTYLRYFSPHPRLSPSELVRFTQVDHRHREALVAISDGEIVGVARFDRVHGSPEAEAEAEVAFVVADDWQGLGLGTALFERLVRRGRAAGITRFVAETLPHNERMIAVFHHAGLPTRTWFDEGTVHIAIDLAPR
jgi:GNAT superfamily N-acetyltransferase